MSQVQIVGGLSVDHLVYENKSAHFSMLGGPALYAALGASAVQPIEVVLSTWLPADEPRFTDLFHRFSINTNFCLGNPKAERVWILHDRVGRKLVPINGAYNTELQNAPLSQVGLKLRDFLQPALCKTILLCSPEPGIVVEGATLVIDPHQIFVQNMGIDYYRSFNADRVIFLPSRLQLRLLRTDIYEAITLIRDSTGADVIARLDSEGMFVDCHMGQERIIDNEVRVVETTGAGDSSAGAICAAIALGENVVNAAKIGISVVRHTLSDWGSQGLESYVSSCII